MANFEYGGVLQSVESIRFELDNISDYCMHDNEECESIKRKMEAIKEELFWIEYLADLEGLKDFVKDLQEKEKRDKNEIE